MAEKIYPYFIAVSAFFIFGCAGPETKVLKITDKIIQAKASYDRNLNQIDSLARHFKKSQFSAKNLRNYSDKTIIRLYEAVAAVARIFPEKPRYIQMQEKVLEEKLRRPRRNNFDVLDMYENYIRSRMFEKAHRLKTSFPDVDFPYIPEKIIMDKTEIEQFWRIYQVSDKGKTAELKNLQLNNKFTIVMIMFPGCPMAEKAMKDIISDSELFKIFKRFGIILTDCFNTEAIFLWKKYFNFPRIYIVYKTSDFSDFNFRISPSFYLLKNGKIVWKRKGWGKKALTEIKAEIKKYANFAF